MRQRGQLDYLILFIVIGLIALGLIVLASASSDVAKSKLDDASYYLSHQIIYGFLLGLVGFIFTLYFPYQKYKKASMVLMILGIISLVLVFVPGIGLNLKGATRWLQFGPITVQPAEIIKIVLIIYLAAIFSSERVGREGDLWKRFVPFAIVLGLVSVLLLLERSTSSVAIIGGAAIAIYFASGAKKRYLFYFLGAGILGLALLIMVSPYRFQRVQTFFAPSADSSGAGYQVERAKISIGSGGFFGVGYGNSLSKRYLPEPFGDSIFAVIAEEFGFVGAISVITAFAFLVIRGYLDAKKSRDPFGKLILVGFSTVIAIQAFMHMAAISGIIPLTGVPLPFISYGGTALAIFMTMIGIMLNISRKIS